MREIIFRGKRIDTGEWVYGSFIPDLLEVYQGADMDGFIKPFGKTKEERLMVEVERETVGQYTGMSGENGKIFEGDIVEFFGMRGVIVQECGAFGIGCSKLIDYDLLDSEIPNNNSANFCYNDNFVSFWELWWNYEQDDFPLFEVKVIGNRWDNPELLEEARHDD